MTTSDRASVMQRLARGDVFDVAVVGGGATGLGVALEAASRGLTVALVEAHDFAKGTSSRATKLVHGGVRYLAQGDIALVREALHERRVLLANAPHLAAPLAFVMPSFRPWERPFYGAGLLAYDLLAGRSGLGSTRFLDRSETLHALPGVQPQGLRGSVLYWDGQFDDARLAIALARTAVSQGAVAANYCEAVDLVHVQRRVAGVECRDVETGRGVMVRARAVVNATGVWVDALRGLDSKAGGREPEPMVTPSQGVHLVVDRDFLPGDHALLVPRTRDGRVLFAVPWLGKVIIGTTDTPREELLLEPRPLQEEVAFLLGESARYLARPPRRADVRSHWVGLRPLVAPSKRAGGATRRLSRSHTIEVSPHGLVTVTGGKWTTYRAMGEEVIDTCLRQGVIDAADAGPPRTAALPLVGAPPPGAGWRPMLAEPPGLRLYGSEEARVLALPGARRNLLDELGLDEARLDGAGVLTEAMVRFAVREEYARSVEDVLGRRSRLLFLDAALAAEVAPLVAAIVSQETGLDARLDEFVRLAGLYANLPA